MQQHLYINFSELKHRDYESNEMGLLNGEFNDAMISHDVSCGDCG